MVTSETAGAVCNIWSLAALRIQPRKDCPSASAHRETNGLAHAVGAGTMRAELRRKFETNGEPRALLLGLRGAVRDAEG